MKWSRFTRLKTPGKKYHLALLLVLLSFNGCTQDHHDFHMPGKIPIDAKRWYQLNNTSNGLDQLFDGKINEEVNTGWGTVLKHYEAWYPLGDGEQMTIDSIMMYDGKGACEDNPMTIYAVADDWKRTPIAIFTGMRYNQWNGPDPEKPNVYTLKQPTTNIRYLVIDTWGQFPDEIEFYGKYTPPKPVTKAIAKPAPLKNFFGVNAFEWDFEDGANAGSVDPKRADVIKSFTGVRHYLDWEKLEPAEGSYTFNPARSGGWNEDAIYEWCQKQRIEVVACIKTIPIWMQATYPADQRDNEDIPARFGSDLNDPSSYREQAKLAFQFAARYGNNKNVDRTLLSVDKKPRWTADPVNEVKVGLGLIKYIECDNERDKWWKGRKAYQTGREYAANLSAFYDGNKGKMGAGAGVKNADSSMKVVMAGLASTNTDYLRGMIDWSLELRGRRKDGTIDLPWDIINYHYYANDGDLAPGNKQYTGVAPEISRTAQIADNFIQLAHQYADDMPVWVTETGYDINSRSIQRAPTIEGKSALETQADWILRTSLLYAKTGVQRVFFYELDDDNINNETKYASSGLVTGANGTRVRRPAADYLYQVNKLFGNYSHKETLNRDPLVDCYAWSGKTMYSLVVPDQKGRTGVYTLNLGAAEWAYIYKPQPGEDNMSMTKKKTTNGKVEIMVTETPIFVTGFDCESK